MKISKKFWKIIGFVSIGVIFVGLILTTLLFVIHSRPKGYYTILVKPIIIFNIATFVISIFLARLSKDRTKSVNILVLIYLLVTLTLVAPLIQSKIVDSVYGGKMPVYVENESKLKKMTCDAQHTYYSKDYNLIKNSKYKVDDASSVKYKQFTDRIYINDYGVFSVLDLVGLLFYFTNIGFLFSIIIVEKLNKKDNQLEKQ